MAINASQLLRQLEPAVRPNVAAPRQVSGARPLESSSFEQLLAAAAAGTVSSERAIEVGFDVSPPLDATQLERMAAAADQAQAAGAERAVMLIDGRAFVLDVESRTLVSEMTGGSAERLAVIDTAIIVPDENELGSQILGPPSSLPPPIVGRSDHRASAVNRP